MASRIDYTPKDDAERAARKEYVEAFEKIEGELLAAKRKFELDNDAAWRKFTAFVRKHRKGGNS